MRSDKLHRQIFLTGLHTAVIVPHLFEKGYILFLPKYCSEMNPIELEWQHLKEDELAEQMFEDELELAYAVINGVEDRGKKGNY